VEEDKQRMKTERDREGRAYGERSWRYAIINNNNEKIFIAVRKIQVYLFKVLINSRAIIRKDTHKIVYVVCLFHFQVSFFKLYKNCRKKIRHLQSEEQNQVKVSFPRPTSLDDNREVFAEFQDNSYQTVFLYLDNVLFRCKGERKEVLDM
jgi:hypothetical protein